MANSKNCYNNLTVTSQSDLSIKNVPANYKIHITGSTAKPTNQSDKSSKIVPVSINLSIVNWAGQSNCSTKDFSKFQNSRIIQKNPKPRKNLPVSMISRNRKILKAAANSETLKKNQETRKILKYRRLRKFPRIAKNLK